MSIAVFLDRDGVVNKAIIKNGQAFSPRCFEEFEFVDGIARQIKRIKDAGFLVVVVTNQPEIKRGKMDISELEKMNNAVRGYLAIDDIFTCMHDDIDNCLCRKPKPGMLFDAAKKFEIDLDRSFLIGDGRKDMGAAYNAGCKGILIDAPYNRDVDNIEKVENLKEAVDIILREKEDS